MLNEKQNKWISHLSTESRIKIIPFDSTTQDKFEKIRSIIRSKLGNVSVEHCGATSLGISGQDEIDVYIPVSPEDFNNFIDPLIELFGNPRSLYELERARFVVFEQGKHIDVFLINKESSGWLDSVKFEDYLRNHKESLAEYERLKNSGNGMNTQEYYKMKTIFINDILSRIK